MLLPSISFIFNESIITTLPYVFLIRFCIVLFQNQFILLRIPDAYEGAFIPASIMRFIISNATSLSVHPFVFGQENFSVCPVLQYPYLSILRAKEESLYYGTYSFQMLSAGFCWRNSIYSHSCRYHKPLCLGFRYSGNPVWCLYALSP